MLHMSAASFLVEKLVEPAMTDRCSCVRLNRHKPLFTHPSTLLNPVGMLAQDIRQHLFVQEVDSVLLLQR